MVLQSKKSEEVAIEPSQTDGSTTLLNTPISFGEKSLLPGDILPAKAEGIRAINKKNFAEAVTQLTEALTLRRNRIQGTEYRILELKLPFRRDAIYRVFIKINKNKRYHNYKYFCLCGVKKKTRDTASSE